MKIPKMLLQYTLMFTVPSAVALYYWQPRSDEEIRRDVEAKVRPDMERRRKNQAKYRELLLQRQGATSHESQQQLEDVTSFAAPRKS
ncbi:hypothetical protein P43SY_007010 [Pythium insidiosum]|uniref:Uncharacterized protein n=1 Tax=Pythium insidiosum TaxID=114742 RepID=A0AAD5Q9C2_PYTIN|nr:hypothetical protein P43SY_007010 [Pythium insidiosum]KAJ0407595.1 hypothetical protein ATCC90586_006238 [Pythium insidiosum]